MTKIPKHLHQVWLGNNPIPDNYIKWRDNWRKLHPDWEYTLWTDKDVVELDPLLNKCIKFSSKSNVVRLWVIKEFGGVYVDMDFDWNKNIDIFLEHSAFVAKEVPTRYCNAFFGAVKHHPWVIRQFNMLDKYVHKKPPWGPTVMTISSKDEKDLYVIDTELVYPYLWDNPYKDASTFKNAYLVHHWSKSWAIKS